MGPQVAQGNGYFAQLEHRPAAALADEQVAMERLTLREFEVFNLLALGHPVNDIAKMLNISQNTAGVHQTRIMNKLGLQNAAQLVRLAIRHGVVEAYGAAGREAAGRSLWRHPWRPGWRRLFLSGYAVDMAVIIVTAAPPHPAVVIRVQSHVRRRARRYAHLRRLERPDLEGDREDRLRFEDDVLEQTE